MRINKASKIHSFFIARWIFLRLLGLSYLLAFFPLLFEIRGLIGSEGILPLQNYLAAVQQQFSENPQLAAPTVFWWNIKDYFLLLICGEGAMLAVFVLFGFLQLPSLILLWLLYLSVVVVGQGFIEYQWDLLLLEVGFLAIFFTPLRITSQIEEESPPPAIAYWLLLWVLFRVLFFSGYAKLAGGDPGWLSLTALNNFFETQPFPTEIAWYAHQLSEPVKQGLLCLLLAAEIAVPFMIFLPARFRFWAFFPLAGAQLAIALCGHYAFFNLLILALCFLLVPDRIFLKISSAALYEKVHAFRREPPVWLGHLQKMILIPLASLIVFISVLQIISREDLKIIKAESLPPQFVQLLQKMSAFRIVNNYGFYAYIPKERREIAIEASNDGSQWQAFSLKSEAAQGGQPPFFLWLWQPRFDWRLWALALESCQEAGLLQSIADGIFQEAELLPEVFAVNPFPNQSPDFVRTRLLKFEFALAEEKAASGIYWKREELGEFCPVWQKKKDKKKKVKLQPEDEIY